MLPQSSKNILTLSNTQAKELAGRVVKIGGATYSFQSYDHATSRPAPVAYRGGGKGLSAGRPGWFGNRVPEVFHSPDAEAARSDGLADRPANAHAGCPILPRRPCFGPTPAMASTARKSTSSLPLTSRRPFPARPGWNTRAASQTVGRDFPKTFAGVASRICSWRWPRWNGRNSCMATCHRTM